MNSHDRDKTKASGMLDQSILNDIIRRVVEVAQPEQIILFGSAARGDMNRHSDVDLLVVKDGVHRGHLTNGYTKASTAPERPLTSLW